ncbi:MAG: hypothetical protein EXR66_05730 [Dehalococcoidia bacterium]|nr:hypothetical protein [Dehalococcoidia bacterium]
MELFGVGIGEAGLVLLITMLVVGPERFPQIAREAGKYYRMARRFTAEVTGDLTMALKELENEVNEQTGDIKAVREIGNEVRAGVTEGATDMRAIGAGAVAAASTDTTPSAASPEGRREPEAPEPMTAPPVAVPANRDPFARVSASYADYHTPTANAGTENEAEAPRPSGPPYSSEQVVGVNPFGSTDPVMPPPRTAAATVEAERVAEVPSEPAETTTSTTATPKPASGS